MQTSLHSHHAYLTLKSIFLQSIRKVSWPSRSLEDSREQGSERWFAAWHCKWLGQKQCEPCRWSHGCAVSPAGSGQDGRSRCTAQAQVHTSSTPSVDQHMRFYSTWAARCNTWLLVQLTPQGVVYSFLFSLPQQLMSCSLHSWLNAKSWAGATTRGCCTS